jgi:energy-converting hydrogenase Eha subunit G
MNFFLELKKRWNQESPAFHQKLISFGKWLLGTAVALTALPSAYQLLFPNAGIELTILVKVSGQMGLIGLIISTVAGTAVKNPESLAKKD